jgi:pimeloyl-ACP methyl ester carboxylesterase
VTQTARPVDVISPDGASIGGYLCMHKSGAPILLVLGDADEILADTLTQWEERSRDAGANLFMIDWPGYASSSGNPSFTACRAAARAALEFLLDKDGEVPSVVVVGRGLGSVFAIDLFKDGARPRMNGLVLDGGITDVADWVAERVPWDKTGFNPAEVMTEIDAELARAFDPEDVLTGLSIPALVLHALYDPANPVENGHCLAEWASAEPVVWLDQGESPSAIFELNGKTYVNALSEYLAVAAPCPE